MKKFNQFFLFLLLPSFTFLLGALISWHFKPGNDLTPLDIKHAQKLIGLDFTDVEIDSMLEGLQAYRKEMENNRKLNIENDLAPALVFNPLPEKLQLEQKQMPIVWSDAGKVNLPPDRNELAFYTVRQLGELIKNKKISSLELTRFFLERLKEFGPQLECVITLTEELALKQARSADQEIKAGKYRGPLHGIPYGLKDLFAVENYKTTWGSVPFKDQVLNYNATVVNKLEKAGAVLVAKLTLGELAWGDVWFGGFTRNPWNTKNGSSGSSAGSASSVAAGLVPFAIGTETLGSIVSPSTVCGVTGLRPTFGRVSRAGGMTLCWSSDKVGPMCRSVEDCALVFEAIIGKDGLDKSVIEAAFNYNAKKDLKKIRVGYVKKTFENEYRNKKFDNAVLDKFREMGVELIPIELPVLPDISLILWAEAAAAFDELTRNNQDDLLRRQIKNAWPNFFRKSRFIPAVEYIQANRIRTRLIEQMYELFQNIDVYICPSFGANNLTLTNLTGHPCLVLPNGFTDAGTPVSISFIGNLFGEADLLRVAKAYQDATAHHLKHPVLKK